GERKRARDHGLGRDDRSSRSERNERNQQLRRRQKIEGIGGSLRIRQQQGALPEVVEHQGGQRNREPRELNRGVTEMPEIGVQRFTTGDDQEDRAQHEQAAPRVIGKEPNGVRRYHRTDDGGILENAVDSQHRDRA